MTSREKVLNALNFKEGPVPRDLGGMASTGISAFAYPALVELLGLEPRKPKVYDIYQMLAMVDMDVLDALNCDVVSIVHGATNAFDEREKWQDFDFNGRLDAQVRDRSIFRILENGTIRCDQIEAQMPPSSVVFDQAHGGHGIDLSDELPKPDLDELDKELLASVPRDDELETQDTLCRKARGTTDKAVMFSGPVTAGIAIGSSLAGGIAVFPMLCLLEEGYVKELHSLITEYSLRKIDKLIPRIKDNVDILMFSSDDWGTQNGLLAPPGVYEKLFLPYLKRMITRIKELAPDMKVFLHSCGNIIEIIPMIIEAGYDVLNPVQWSTTGPGSYKKWKELTDGKIALWGGGVDSQHTLNLATIAEIVAESREARETLSTGGGYVFNNIHNFLAETDPRKIKALYDF
jgi:uroporphyrinogen decarboxylase